MPKTKKRSSSKGLGSLKSFKSINRTMMFWLTGLFVLAGIVLYFATHASGLVNIKSWPDTGHKVEETASSCQQSHTVCLGDSSTSIGGYSVKTGDVWYYKANPNNNVYSGTWFWYGPYITLGPGNYTVCATIRHNNGAASAFQVTKNSGSYVIGKTFPSQGSDFNGDCINNFIVPAGQSFNNVEFRVGPGQINGVIKGSLDILNISLYRNDPDTTTTTSPPVTINLPPGTPPSTTPGAPTTAPKAGPVSTIQGFKVATNNVNGGIAGAAITCKTCWRSPVSTNAEPYFFRGVPQGNQRIHADTPAGYKLAGYTLCYDSTNCHGNQPTPIATSGPDTGDVVVNTSGHSYADLWFHYAPDPVSVVASTKTSIIEGYKVLTDNSIPTTPGLATVSYICCRPETVLNGKGLPVGADGNGNPSVDDNPFFFTNLPLGYHRLGIPNIPAGFDLLGAKICLSTTPNCDINAQPIQAVDKANGNSIVVNTDDGQGNPVKVDLRWVFQASVSTDSASKNPIYTTPACSAQDNCGANPANNNEDQPVVYIPQSSDTPTNPVTAPGNGARRRCLILFTCTTKVKPTPVLRPLLPTNLPTAAPAAPAPTNNNAACQYVPRRIARLLGCR